MPQWTKPQRDAIFARGGSILVSAAAGSGKTAVLVERAITLICDEKNPVDADKLLIVTFSNAAAAEMRQRMSLRLAEMIRENPADLFLQRQQNLLSAAQISTIHSFCLELLRNNFHNLNISPDFSIADEHELAIMKNDCASACVESRYENGADGGFAELVELLFTGRDDSRLTEAIIKIYDFSRSHPYSDDWLDEKLAMYDTELPVSETVWGNSILRYAFESLKFCLDSARLAVDMLSGDEKMEKAYGSAFRSDIEQLDGCCKAVNGGEWDEAVRRLSGFVFEKLFPLRGDDPVKQRVKDIRARNKEIIQKLAKKYLNVTEADFRLDIEDIRPKIGILFSLVKDFSARFTAAKSDKRRLDFSDFEHLALKLLVKKTPGGYVRTALAGEIAARFEYVLVDEYQDTNEVQDLIFTSVSREQQNLFMVGDVKQSIYAFRQAMPEIFMAKRQKFFPYDTGFFPAKINLDTNFRSRGQVTGAVNFLFGMLMSESLGDVDYNAEESLKCGAEYPDYEPAKPAMLLISAAGYDGERDAVSLEAYEIAKHICKMLDEGYMVAEGGEMRPAIPRDFCVLMRAPKNRSDIYVRELTAQGIPARADGSGGFLDSREVSSVVCMLKAVDNPLLDVELVAAMLSPFFNFTDDDIARIRLNARSVPFYSALCSYAAHDEKSAAFLRILHELRAKSAILPADRLIMLLYDLTGAVPISRAMRSGEIRAANLRLLVEYAAEYHQLGYRQLGGFVGFLNRLSDKGRDLSPADTVGGGANAVRVMSAHHSKGLEFPVVFLADAAKAFNKMDLRAATMLHSKYGFACIRRDHALLKQFPTAPMQSIRLESERAMMSEELRILYVALTRAREKLIISACVKGDIRKKLAGLQYGLEGAKLAAYAALDANSYVDWVLSALLHHKSAELLRSAAGITDLELVDDGNEWEFILREPVSDEDEVAAADSEQISKPDRDLLDELRRRAEYAYPFEARAKTPAKLAVSAVSKRERGVSHRFSSRPKFMTEYALTAAEKGNAMHKFMQFSDYLNARNNLAGEIERMRIQRFLSRAEVDSLNKKKLRDFFESELAKRIFASPKVYRELKFMSECGKEIIGGAVDGMDGDSRIVLQGVADCVFIEDDGAVIVDYKTDSVASPDELVRRYKSQLLLYKAILGESLGLRVKECIIYSFALSSEVICDLL